MSKNKSGAQEDLINSSVYLPGGGQNPSFFFTSGSQFDAFEATGAGPGWATTEVAVSGFGAFWLDSGPVTVGDGFAGPVGFLMGGAESLGGTDAPGGITSAAGFGLEGLIGPGGEPVEARAAELAAAADWSMDGGGLTFAAACRVPPNRIIEPTTVAATTNTPKIKSAWLRRLRGYKMSCSVVVDGVSVVRRTSRALAGVPRVGVANGRTSPCSVPSKLDTRFVEVVSTPHTNRNVSAASAIEPNRFSGLRWAARANHSSKPAGTLPNSEGFGSGSVQIANTSPPSVSA